MARISKVKVAEIYLKKGCNVSATCVASNISRDTIYTITSNFEVLQSIDGGLLLTGSDYYDNSCLIFMKTDKEYPDGYRINKSFLISDGLYEYQTILGSSKKVYSFIQTPVDSTYYFLK